MALDQTLRERAEWQKTQTRLQNEIEDLRKEVVRWTQRVKHLETCLAKIRELAK